MKKSVRMFARKMAQELSADEINAVSGGVGGYCFVTSTVGGQSVTVYERD